VRPGAPAEERIHVRIWLIRSRMGQGAAAVTELKKCLADRKPAADPD
jgi:hypothetical protein